MMKATVVRYQAKPERADENQRLIEAVFAELDEREPDGFTYEVFRLEDGVSFVDVVIEHDIPRADAGPVGYARLRLVRLIRRRWPAPGSSSRGCRRGRGRWSGRPTPRRAGTGETPSPARRCRSPGR